MAISAANHLDMSSPANTQDAPATADFRTELLKLLESATADEVARRLNRENVTSLDLSGCKLSINGFDTLVQALSQTRITALSLATCGLTDDFPVFCLLGERSPLVELNLSGNALTSVSAPSIGRHLARNSTLASLDLSGNRLDQDVYDDIMRVLGTSGRADPSDATASTAPRPGFCSIS